ncbi:secretory carrier-associated membrane protein 1-like isoform X2 [Anneissia japonica]|uniref:secretory carrier-associated membrane protein 1-like isoform X2 n=1 Tax=Anneissia japonica TaxID=1529436 RepID=UPI0014258B83|nr:secretory carrier-associated membrane protein 1-like isoform X2 [Anneissia japonica]
MDTSVQQATSNNHKGLEEYNPFEESNKQTLTQPTRPATAPKQPDQQPAVLQPTGPPPPYTQSAAQPAVQAGHEDLIKRQEELERKAAELQRREQQINNAQYNTRQNNWPPLPSWLHVQPCFYQDFSVDIPLDFQRTVKMGYYLWMLYVLTLFLNLIGAMAYLFSKSGGNKATTFGLAIVWFVAFSPCSFICWYRPIYKAFRSDSSFNFFMFFFIFFCQFCANVIQAIGLDGWGTCGWIVCLKVLSYSGGSMSSAQRISIGIIMMIVAILFTALATLNLLFLKKVHSLYRSTGASFQKAQEEFAHGVVTNPGVQTATKEAAKGAASGVAAGMFSGGSTSNNQM